MYCTLYFTFCKITFDLYSYKYTSLTHLKLATKITWDTHLKLATKITWDLNYTRIWLKPITTKFVHLPINLAIHPISKQNIFNF